MKAVIKQNTIKFTPQNGYTEKSTAKKLQNQMSAVFVRPNGEDKAEVRLNITSLNWFDNDIKIILQDSNNLASQTTSIAVKCKISHYKILNPISVLNFYL